MDAGSVGEFELHGRPSLPVASGRLQIQKHFEKSLVVAYSRYRYAAATGGVPWQLSFSFGRGLQAAPQKVWSGKRENVAAAQQAFYHRAKVSSPAREGRYSLEMEKATAAIG